MPVQYICYTFSLTSGIDPLDFDISPNPVSVCVRLCNVSGMCGRFWENRQSTQNNAFVVSGIIKTVAQFQQKNYASVN